MSIWGVVKNFHFRDFTEETRLAWFKLLMSENGSDVFW